MVTGILKLCWESIIRECCWAEFRRDLVCHFAPGQIVIESMEVTLEQEIVLLLSLNP